MQFSIYSFVKSVRQFNQLYKMSRFFIQIHICVDQLWKKKRIEKSTLYTLAEPKKKKHILITVICWKSGDWMLCCFENICHIDSMTLIINNLTTKLWINTHIKLLWHTFLSLGCSLIHFDGAILSRHDGRTTNSLNVLSLFLLSSILLLWYHLNDSSMWGKRKIVQRN